MPGKNENQGTIVVGPKIRALCDVPAAEFDFDSAKLSAEAKNGFDVLAACFVSGKAAGKHMRIVGHADPRGPEDYNLGLGQRRAGSVARHLHARGMTQDRIETSSRGELDARGTDEASWGKDRKVELFLAEPGERAD